MAMEVFLDEPLNKRRARSVYLITYSQADMERFPTREGFAKSVVDMFNEGRVKVESWVCCRESHKDGGKHYHLAIKLTAPKRWALIKTRLIKQLDISVHFSSSHDLYYSAWEYVTKQDGMYIQSEKHPDFEICTPPRTTAATRKRKVDQKIAPKEGIRGKKKQKRLTCINVADIITKAGIHSRTELLALAQRQKNLGNTLLAEFILNRGKKNVNDLIESTWEMHGAHDEIARNKRTRLEILQDFSTGQCVNGCDGQWLAAAIDVLEGNDIECSVFAAAVLQLLEKGRGKYRNIMIVGPANCGKTFLLRPLCTIFQCFINPASTSFAWVGAEKAEVIFLNDFRWSSQIIPWHDLLQMLEGQPVHLSAPKTHYAQDLLLHKDTPIFCTSSSRIRFITHGVINERETEMMEARWKVFSFWKQIPSNEQRDIVPCGTCFAQLISGNGHNQ